MIDRAFWQDTEYLTLWYEYWNESFIYEVVCEYFLLNRFITGSYSAGFKFSLKFCVCFFFLFRGYLESHGLLRFLGLSLTKACEYSVFLEDSVEHKADMIVSIEAWFDLK